MGRQTTNSPVVSYKRPEIKRELEGSWEKYIVGIGMIVVRYNIGLLSFILLKPTKVLESYGDEIKGAHMVRAFYMTEINR